MKRALIVTLVATFGGAVDAVAQDADGAQLEFRAQELQKGVDVPAALELRMRWITRVTAPSTAVVPVVALTVPVVKEKGVSWVHPDYAPSLAPSRAPQSLRRTGGKR